MDIPSSGYRGGGIRMSFVDARPAATGGILHLGWVGLTLILAFPLAWLPDSAWADGKLAELAGQDEWNILIKVNQTQV